MLAAIYYYKLTNVMGIGKKTNFWQKNGSMEEKFRFLKEESLLFFKVGLLKTILNVLKNFLNFNK